MANKKVLQLIGKGLTSGTKTITVNNCIAESDFDTTDVTPFWTEYDGIYGTDFEPVEAKYVVTSDTVVFPAA